MVCHLFLGYDFTGGVEMRALLLLLLLLFIIIIISAHYGVESESCSNCDDVRKG